MATKCGLTSPDGTRKCIQTIPGHVDCTDMVESWPNVAEQERLARGPMTSVIDRRTPYQKKQVIKASARGMKPEPRAGAIPTLHNTVLQRIGGTDTRQYLATRKTGATYPVNVTDEHDAILRALIFTPEQTDRELGQVTGIYQVGARRSELRDIGAVTEVGRRITERGRTEKTWKATPLGQALLDSALSD